MHILMMVLGAIGAGVFWWYRMRDAANIAGEVVDKAQRLRGAHKRKKFRDSAAKSPYAAIDDPVVAAVSAIIVMAEDCGGFDAAAEERLKESFEPIASSELIEEAVIYGKWAEKQGIEMSGALRLVGPSLCEMLNIDEREDVIKIASNVLVEQNSRERNALKLLRQKLNLPVDI